MMSNKQINIAWVTRSFLDYRIPVFVELDRLLNGRLHLIFSGDYVPESVQAKAHDVLGERSIAMCGEWKLGSEDAGHLANRNFCVRFQPGLFKTIRNRRPDVIIGDGFFKWTLPALVYRLVYQTPLIILYERTAHTERHAQRVRTWYRQAVVRFTDAMGCNGSLSKAYTETLGMPPERITTGHMTADTEGLRQKAQQVTKQDIASVRHRHEIEGSLYTYVGRLHHCKGLLELLVGWRDFERTYPRGGTLLLVGEGEQEQALKRFTQENSLRGVRFAGRVNYDEIAPYYSASDVFVIPTLEDNWSLVVPEAMACGLPILCSKYNGCYPELVEPDGNGWVFDPLDGRDTFEALERCVENQDNLVAMGDRSREIIANHTPAHAAESILEACRIAISHRKR